MTTLSDRTPLATLAHILHAAAALGSDAWSDGDDRRQQHAAPERALSDDLIALFKILRDRSVDYLLVGGVAMLRYIEGRNTDDIDLIIAAESLDQLSELTIHDRTWETAQGRFRNLRVDLLFTSNSVFQFVQQRHATVHRFAEVDVPCATVDGLLILKLYALPSLYRQGDLQRVALYETDVTMLAMKHPSKISESLALLRPYVAEGDHSELSRIAGEIESRIDRMHRR